MKRSTLCALWGVCYIICAGLGFIPEPEGTVRVLLAVISMMFFVPPAMLLWDANQRGDRAVCRRICSLSALSLGLTLVTLIAGILTAMRSETVGNVLHILLGIVSVPMFCSNYWALSLFCWAVLLITAGKGAKKK